MPAIQKRTTHVWRQGWEAPLNFVHSQQPLFTVVRMGKLELRNRIVMAPLTRMRAANSEHAPTEFHAEYYAQAPLRVSSLANAPKSAPMPTVGPIRLVCGALSKFGDGAA
jgi:hypothetical protein